MICPRTSSRFVVACALIALWLGVPLASLLHGAHAHRYCPEHQAFEELGEGDAGAAELAERLTLRASEPEGTERVDHLACPFAPTRTDARWVEAQTGRELRLEVLAPRSAMALGFVAHPVPILAAAPKQSPPLG